MLPVLSFQIVTGLANLPGAWLVLELAVQHDENGEWFAQTAAEFAFLLAQTVASLVSLPSQPVALPAQPAIEFAFRLAQIAAGLAFQPAPNAVLLAL